MKSSWVSLAKWMPSLLAFGFSKRHVDFHWRNSEKQLCPDMLNTNEIFKRGNPK